MLKRITFSLLIVVILVMVSATLVEKQIGSATAIYGSWWFASLWALLAVTGLCYCLRRQMQRRPALLLLHISFVVILAGALITHIWGITGMMHIREGQTTTDFVTDEDHLVHQLPFALRLSEFEVVNYAGTQTPMDFRSSLCVITYDDLRKGQLDTIPQYVVSMNNIAEIDGYRFYQSSYDSDMHGTILSVNYDPVGIGVTYTGYGLLFISMLLLLVLPSEGFRRSLRRLTALSALLLLPVLKASAAETTPKTLTPDEAHAFCSLYAYHNGRICPMQTLAKDFTLKLYGRDHAAGYSFEQVFTGWLFYPTTWVDVPRKERKDRYQEEQQAVIEMLLAGEFLHIFPYQDRWLSPADQLPEEWSEEEWFFVRKSMDYLGELTVTGQHEQLLTTISKIRKYQSDRASASALPSDNRFRAEMLYNRADYTRPMAMGFATLGIVLFLVFVLTIGGGKQLLRWLIVACDVVLMLAFAYLFFLFILRWYVSGHLPMSNGFETMQFMALCVVLLTLVLSRYLTLLRPFGFLLCGLTLLVSTFGQGNPQITPLMPVLQSPLLSLHVCVIMLSYSLLAFTFLNGVAALMRPGLQEPLLNVSRMLLFPAQFCMAAGIFIGAIWANVSWGRYWGWDPKEVWALITFLVYSFALHVDSLPMFRRPKSYHIFMVLAFLSVLMTYFGVNFLLGGMHSYANG